MSDKSKETIAREYIQAKHSKKIEGWDINDIRIGLVKYATFGPTQTIFPDIWVCGTHWKKVIDAVVWYDENGRTRKRWYEKKKNECPFDHTPNAKTIASLNEPCITGPFSHERSEYFDELKEGLLK